MTKTILSDSSAAINKEVQTIATLSSGIAHELRGYLTTINLCAELSEIQTARIKKTVKSANYLLGNLMTQIKCSFSGKFDKRGFKYCSIKKNIEEALEQYSFKEAECKLITLDLLKDFEYLGDSVLTSHILYNLIKNSLRAIANAGKGNINIHSITGCSNPETGAKYNKLIFKDTATGIAKEFLPKMFELFESQSVEQGGTGVGLAFCKLIMQSYGGDIVCNSIEGKYTEFVLFFPVIDEKIK